MTDEAKTWSRAIKALRRLKTAWLEHRVARAELALAKANLAATFNRMENSHDQ